MSHILHKNESYTIVSVLFDIYNNLGSGFSEIVYKDALKYKFKTLNIPFLREKEFKVQYKNIILPHKFYSNFVVFDKTILQIKSVESLHNKHIAQYINYLKVSNLKLAILASFNQDLLHHKRIVL